MPDVYIWQSARWENQSKDTYLVHVQHSLLRVRTIPKYSKLWPKKTKALCPYPSTSTKYQVSGTGNSEKLCWRSWIRNGIRKYLHI